jgi:hypothetical protein
MQEGHVFCFTATVVRELFVSYESVAYDKSSIIEGLLMNCNDLVLAVPLAET